MHTCCMNPMSHSEFRRLEGTKRPCSYIAKCFEKSAWFLRVQYFACLNERMGVLCVFGLLG